jgi:hypothetical protein
MNKRINVSGKTWISLTLMIIGATVAIMAVKWPFRTALFPVSIGACVFAMALADLFLGLFGKEDASAQGALGTKLTETAEDVDPETAFRRTLVMFAWIFGFFLMIVLLGFTVAVPLLVFLYLKVQSREGWVLSLVLTGATLILFYGLFVWLIETPFPEGWIIRWLGTIGIG